MQRRIRRAVLVLSALAAAAALAQPAAPLELPRPSPKGSVTQTVGTTEIGVAFSTAAEGGGVRLDELNGYFAAAYEAAHEAVLNCLVAARPARRRDGAMQEAFPI